MYPRSFLREEAKIKQRTPLKKKLCEIGEEAIWESRFTSFFYLLSYFLQKDDWLKAYAGPRLLTLPYIQNFENYFFRIFIFYNN